MNKRVKKIILGSIIAVAIIALIVSIIIIISKTRISQRYADRINNAYESGNPFTYNEVMTRLGDPYSSQIEGSPTTATGYAEWFEGYPEGKEAKFVEDYRKGKKIDAIYIEFINGVAVGARFYVANIETDYETETE